MDNIYGIIIKYVRIRTYIHVELLKTKIEFFSIGYLFELRQ